MQPDTNATEPDSPRTWAVSSVVQIPTARERHGEKLKCVAIHESYAARSVAVEAKMDVKCEYYENTNVVHNIFFAASIEMVQLAELKHKQQRRVYYLSRFLGAAG